MKTSRFFRLFSLALVLVSLFGPGIRPAFASGATFVVNTVDDGHDAVPGDGFCDTGTGFQLCTLRAAIEEANVLPGADTIHFAIPGTGIHQMTIFSAPLPGVYDPLTLDATTQPNCTTPCIALSGSGLIGTTAGLNFLTSNSTVKGFIVTSFSYYGIMVTGDMNTVQRNYVGFVPGSATMVGNQNGIYVAGSDNVIGGSGAGQRNVISGNIENGITVGDGVHSTVGNSIMGNYIGTNIAGTAARGNGHDGIFVTSGSTDTFIGGSTAGTRNVISGNGGAGIEMGGSNSLIQNNFIGTRADGKGSIGNALGGVWIYGTATNNVVGGTLSGSRNRIAHNGQSGIGISPIATGQNRFQRNQIFRNGGLGIDLGLNGVTLNDALDADTGPNGLQNYPIIGSASSSTLLIAGRLNSTAYSTYTIEFFSSPAGTCDPSHHGEGQKFLGSKSVTTDGTGYARIRFVSPLAFPLGAVITATATDSLGNTSEFSTCRAAS